MSQRYRKTSDRWGYKLTFAGVEYRLLSPQWKGYELIDFGEGQRLERWGKLILQRPDGWAVGPPAKPIESWRPQHRFLLEGAYQGRWEPPLPEAWTMSYTSKKGWTLHLEVRPTRYKHLGLFPEQAVHWEWLYAVLHSEARVLNLFAYTGAASIVAALAGAKVTHVDASKPALTWANRNAQLNHLSTIRWIHDDVRTFVQREKRRGHRYDLILLDPPAYGLSPEGKRWVLEQDLPPLLSDLATLLETNGSFLLNTYSGDLSPATLLRLVQEFFGPYRNRNRRAYPPNPTGPPPLHWLLLTRTPSGIRKPPLHKASYKPKVKR
jgi:23S rRNA (cytosine1962-C5)-methyltransferase